MKKNIFEIALLIGLCITLTVSALAKEEQDNISERILRLHIVANSDSAFDQSIKLSVRNELSEQISSLLKNCGDKEKTLTVIRENLREFEETATRICRDKNADYSAFAQLETVHFPTKDCDLVSLPAGKYDSLTIKLGKAEGKNWWCVLFPQLCDDAVSDEIKKAELSKSEVLLMTSDKPQYRLKFRILELIDKLEF